MSKGVPLISKYMTAMPHTIDSKQSLAQASALMKTHKIRHLPVQSGSKTVGLLSLQDLNLLASFASVNPETTQVESAMSSHPYCVTPDAAIDEVASHMAEHRIGSALIVQDNGTLVGIFTDTDALRTLAEVFQNRLKK